MNVSVKTIFGLSEYFKCHFYNKPRFHAEANFANILAPKIYKTATLSDLLS